MAAGLPREAGGCHPGAQGPDMIDLHATRRYSIPDTAEPGWPELCDVLDDVLPRAAPCDEPVELERLKSRVYRLQAGSNGRVHSFVLKRFDPWLARRNELVLRRWLPACSPGCTGSATTCPDGCTWSRRSAGPIRCCTVTCGRRTRSSARRPAASCRG